MKHTNKLKKVWFIPSFPLLILIAQKLLKIGFSIFLLMIMLDPFVTAKCILLNQKYARTVLTKQGCNSICYTQTGPHGVSGTSQSWPEPFYTFDVPIV